MNDSALREKRRLSSVVCNLKRPTIMTRVSPSTKHDLKKIVALKGFKNTAKFVEHLIVTAVDANINKAV